MAIYFLSPSVANPKSHDVRIGASHRVLKRTHYRYGPGQVFANDSWGVSLPYLDRNFFLAIYTEFKLGGLLARCEFSISYLLMVWLNVHHPICGLISNMVL
jgi:hypothetical protein